MNGKPKFTMNAFVIVVTVFVAITLFVTVGLVGLRNPFPVNEYYPIEGTPYAVRYSTLEPNGIYKGPQNACTLALKGSFGSGWGLVKSGDALYTNEYAMTDLGLMRCDLVRVDLNSFEKETLMRDTVLRGACASGELVCVGGYILPANSPATNPLCGLYGMTRAELEPGRTEAEVLYLDPKSGEEVWRTQTPDALAEDFDETFLARTLEEVRG